jgi:hypothetical protein
MSNSPRNKEYSAPNAARCKENGDRIKRETEVFLAKGGAITKFESNLLITNAHKRTQAKRDDARKRGLKKMKGTTA